MRIGYRVALLALSLLTSAETYAGWTDDWISSKTQSGPSSFEGQKRNYWSGGTYQARFGFTTDHVVSFTPPSISGGCGGINAYGGNLSYLDPEFLVNKLQNIVQAAPAAAFDIAMKTMCQVCSDTMKTLESLSSALNGMQFNECAAAKKLITVASDAYQQKANSSELMDTVGGADAWQEVSKNFEAFKTSFAAIGGKPTVETNTLIEHCPAEFTEIFGNGSVVSNAASKIGLGPYAPLLRGLIGDVDVEYIALDKSYKATPVDPCTENGNASSRLSSFKTGDVYKKSLTNECTADDNDQSIKEYIEAMLLSIATTLADPAGVFDADQTQFIQNAPLPVFRIMRRAVMTQTTAMTIGMLTEPIALAETYQLMDALYMRIGYVIRAAMKSTEINVKKDVAARQVCDPTVLNTAIVKTRQLLDISNTLRNEARVEYLASLKELSAMEMFARHQQDQDKAATKAALKDIPR